jgi:HAE1 family hydrophobic/amphiphilic exporter-1
MTSAALILAMLPLAAKLGDGGEWRAPLAVTVIGGLLTSTFLTLLVIPSVYTLVDDVQFLITSLPARARRLARWLRPTRATTFPSGAPLARGTAASAAQD